MTPHQREEVKGMLVERYRLGEYHSIPHALFLLCLVHGLSLNKAKEIFLEVAQEEGWVFASSSVGALLIGNMEGQRGKKRILKWYLRQFGWQTHFWVGKPTEQELEARAAALEVAYQVRERLDIRPLTTTDIIRELRGGAKELKGG